MTKTHNTPFFYWIDFGILLFVLSLYVPFSHKVSNYFRGSSTLILNNYEHCNGYRDSKGITEAFAKKPQYDTNGTENPVEYTCRNYPIDLKK